MSLPKYNELYSPFLSAIQDGSLYSIKDVKNAIAEQLKLSETDLTEQLPSGTQTVFANRVGWAKTYLKKAGLIDNPKRAYVQITDLGKKLLSIGVEITDSYLAGRFPEFRKFKKGNDIQKSDSHINSIEMDVLESVFGFL